MFKTCRFLESLCLPDCRMDERFLTSVQEAETYIFLISNSRFLRNQEFAKIRRKGRSSKLPRTNVGLAKWCCDQKL